MKSKTVAKEKARSVLLPVYFAVVAMVLCMVFVFYIQLQRPSSEELLTAFESENFGEKNIVVADSIKSGDVLIKLEISEFLQRSDKRTVYKTVSQTSKNSVTYHSFEEGEDGELIEYTTSIMFREWDGGWRGEW